MQNMINSDKQSGKTRSFRGDFTTRITSTLRRGSIEEPAFGVASMDIKCKICETEMLLDDATECPFCGELFCANHVMPCEACAKVLCVDCMEYPEDEPICPECEKMLEGS